MAPLVFVYIFSVFKEHVVMYRGNKSSNRMLDTSKNGEAAKDKVQETGSYIETKQYLIKKRGATSKPNSVLSLS